VAKWGFDDNVAKVRPKLRGGRADVQVTTTESPTEPPPARPPEAVAAPPEPVLPAPAEPPAPESRRRSLFKDFYSPSGGEAAPAGAPPVPATAADLAPEVAPEPVPRASEATPAPEATVAAAVVEAAPAVEAPAVVAEVVAGSEPEPASVPVAAVVAEPEPAVEADPVALVESSARRSALKRKAAGLATLPEPEPSAATAALDLLADLDALESAAQLATELERALSEAAEANEKLRRDLASALDELARSTAESKRFDEKVQRLEGEARERGVVVSDLLRELELLEGERDGALQQAADGVLASEELEDRLLLAERRSAELERHLADSQARIRRFEESAAAQAAQRAAMRTELEGLRRERDGLVARNATLEREAEELGRSRKALDEVHRALSDARLRAQRIRPR
jgi:hypothetical protein